MDFDKFYTDNFSTIQATAMSYLKNKEDAFDATQDTFLKAFEHLDTFDGDSAISTWLVSICINVCKDKLRKKRTEMKTIQEADPFKITELLEDMRQEIATPENILIAEQRGKDISLSFLGLNANVAKALQLRYFDQMAYKDIASEMDVPVGTVRTWLRRGRMSLLPTNSP